MGNSELVLFSLCSDENKIPFVISIMYVYEANANDRKRYAWRPHVNIKVCSKLCLARNTPGRKEKKQGATFLNPLFPC